MGNTKLSKAQRRELYRQVKDVHDARPDFSMEKLADMFHLSGRAHVWWILHHGNHKKR